MPLLYLAKVNLNSRIFEVYNKKLSIEEVCKQIYEKIANETSSLIMNIRNLLILMVIPHTIIVILNIPFKK